MGSGVTWVSFLAGPTMLVSYLVSSLARSRVVDRGDEPSPSVVTEAVTVLSLTGMAWLILRSQSPGRTEFADASAIGFLSSQVLTFWSSMAIWSGLAAIIGHLAPLPHRFGRGSSGVAGALVLLTAFLPLTALAGLGAWVSALSVTREVRSALPLTYVAVVSAEWLFSVVNPAGPWGLVHGPESTLFVAALAGALLFRWSRGDIGVIPAEADLDNDAP